MTISDGVVELSLKPHNFIYHTYSHLLGQNDAYVNHKLGSKPIIYTLITCHLCSHKKDQYWPKSHFPPKTHYLQNMKIFLIFSFFFLFKNFQRNDHLTPTLKMHNVLIVDRSPKKKSKRTTNEMSNYKGEKENLPRIGEEHEINKMHACLQCKCNINPKWNYVHAPKSLLMMHSITTINKDHNLNEQHNSSITWSINYQIVPQMVRSSHQTS